jgi:pimeloyl-ACP methyl ester carboxylesterase
VAAGVVLAPQFRPRSFTVKVVGAGRPIVFIPGLACDGSVWDATIAHLAGKFQTHVVTLAGFAGSRPLDGQPLLPTVHTELIEYIQQNHLEKPILVGHSLGGFLVYWISESAPALVGAAVAVDGAPHLGSLMDPAATSAVIRSRAEGFARPMAAMPPEQFGAAIRSFLDRSIASPEEAARIGVVASRSDPRTVSNAMLFVSTTDLRPDLSKIQAPVLVIAADIAGQVPRATLEASWRAQVDAIPRHEIVFVEHSRHFVMLDQPAAFQEALDRFLAPTVYLVPPIDGKCRGAVTGAPRRDSETCFAAGNLHRLSGRERSPR